MHLEFIFNNPSTPDYSGVDTFCASARRARLECQETEFSLNPKILIKSITCITYSSITEDLLKQKYLDNRLSMLDIASEFSCSKTRRQKTAAETQHPPAQEIRTLRLAVASLRQTAGQLQSRRSQGRIAHYRHHQTDVC